MKIFLVISVFATISMSCKARKNSSSDVLQEKKETNVPKFSYCGLLVTNGDSPKHWWSSIDLEDKERLTMVPAAEILDAASLSAAEACMQKFGCQLSSRIRICQGEKIVCDKMESTSEYTAFFSDWKSTLKNSYSSDVRIINCPNFPSITKS